MIHLPGLLAQILRVRRESRRRPDRPVNRPLSPRERTAAIAAKRARRADAARRRSGRVAAGRRRRAARQANHRRRRNLR